MTCTIRREKGGDMEYQTIQTQEREDKIGIITLHRPDKRNALSIDT